MTDKILLGCIAVAVLLIIKKITGWVFKLLILAVLIGVIYVLYVNSVLAV